jgi:hypothetical protein
MGSSDLVRMVSRPPIRRRNAYRATLARPSLERILMHGRFIRRLASVAGAALLIVALLPGSAVAAGLATQLVISVQPTNTVVNTAISPQVTVKIEDSSGTTVDTSSAVSIAITAGSPAGNLSGTITVTASHGVATFPNLQIDTAGNGFHLTATDTPGGLTSAPSGAFNITPLVVGNHLGFARQPGGGAAGAVWAVQPIVAVYNGSGNVVTTDNSTTVSLTIGTNPAGGTLSCSGGNSMTVTNGLAAFQGCSINVGSLNPYTLAASSNPAYAAATSSAFYISGAAGSLVFALQPGGGAAGAIWNQQPVVEVLNSLGQIATTDYSTIVYLTIGTNPAGGTLSCTGGTSETVVAGVASFTGCSINVASSSYYTLSASSSPANTAATSIAFYIGGSNENLVFLTQPGGGAAGAIWATQPVVEVVNSLNQVVTTDNSTVVYLSIATNPAGGTLSCTGGTSKVAVNGYAYFSGCSINLGSASPYTLTATSSPVWTPATSSAFYVGSSLSAVTIASDTAIGQTTTGFSRATKIVRPGTWITVRFQTSPALAGRTLGVWIAKKTNGVWGAFSPHASITTNSLGVAYYQYRTSSTVWESFLVKFAGDSTAAPSSSSGTQVRWL